jgi:hypothetical protein
VDAVFRGLRNDLGGGLTSTLAGLSTALTYGVMVFGAPTESCSLRGGEPGDQPCLVARGNVTIGLGADKGRFAQRLVTDVWRSLEGADR